MYFCEVIFIITKNFTVIHILQKAYKFSERGIFMTNFLVPAKDGVEHYFYKPYEGICLQIQSPGGSFREHQQVISSGRDIFCVYADSDGVLHLICTDSENHLIYAVRKKKKRIRL